ncbi:hypothetical protein ATJ97_3500 [Georgenia soli]|uniref:Uncharacterized protein n=1 Tax=Georgenia soli TaxID=638953 RepID=A0A2A9EQU0_9MICO|nr:hypothetical protein [Georgenia soli]PFG40956.1 hypothetical protein ATJ97_3500 [Georgenia soli]
MGQAWSVRRHRGRAAAAALVLTAALAGCTQPGGVTGHLSGAAAQASSAAASAALALELYLDGESTATVADITLTDMVDSAGQAGASASAQVVATNHERQLRADVSAAIGKVTDEIVASRALVAGAAPRAGGDKLVADLRRRADELGTTATELEAAAR